MGIPSPLPWAMPLVLALILLCATATDLAGGKIYNWLTFPSMLLGLAWHALERQVPGLGFSATGLVVGGLLFYPAFHWGGMGFGDVKLMAVIGAFMGWMFVINTAVYASFAGGVVAVIVLLARGELGGTLLKLARQTAGLFRTGRGQEKPQSAGGLPYAGILTAGAVAAYFLPPLVK